MKKIEIAKEELQKIALSPNVKFEVAKLVGDPYDPEMPVPEVIASIMNVDSVAPGEKYEYFVPTAATKQVYSVSSCAVTNTQVTPETDADLSFSTYETPRFWVCLDDLLGARYDVFANKAILMSDSLDNLELYLTFALLDAAVPTTNDVVPSTGETTLTYPKLVEMARKMAKYTNKFVLVTGGNCTEDIMLMNYTANKFDAVKLADIGIVKHIAVESNSVRIASTTYDVIDEDVAYLVGISDKKSNKLGHFVRRQIANIAFVNDKAEIQPKERIVLPSDAPISVDTAQKLAYGFIAAEQFGLVVVNAKMIARFTRP